MFVVSVVDFAKHFMEEFISGAILGLSTVLAIGASSPSMAEFAQDIAALKGKNVT